MGRRNRTGQKKIKYCDYSLFFLVVFLFGFGLVMLYSVSAYNAQDKFGDPLNYVRRQLFAGTDLWQCLSFQKLITISGFTLAA